MTGAHIDRADFIVEEKHIEFQREDSSPEDQDDGLGGQTDIEAGSSGQQEVVGAGGHDQVSQLLDHDVGNLDERQLPRTRVF